MKTAAGLARLNLTYSLGNLTSCISYGVLSWTSREEKCMDSTPSKVKVTRWLVSAIFALISVFSVAWTVDVCSPAEVSKAVALAVTGPSSDPWARLLLTYCGAARAYAADMEIEEPPAADFEPSRPEIEQPPPADLEQSDPSTDDDPPADFEPSQPELEQPSPDDLEPSEPEVEGPDE
jgi:hypothetical protein